MQYLLSLVLIGLVVQLSVAPPVTQNKKDEDHSKENEIEDKDEMAGIMEYRRYLQEVVQALENDEGFKEKLQKADEHDLRTGKIADHLEFVNHKVRTKLDELKREELERLRHLARKESHLMNGLDFDHLKIAEHLDHTNTRTFEIQDLKNLIAKTTKDLAEADRKRREEFKEYEMQKKFEEHQKIQSMDDSERKKYEEELKAIREKHKKHEPVHHPGSKHQLEEVWEKQDHMESEDFNPRTFFFLHDVDGNGVWDQDEVKALFLKELDKLYAQGAPEDDVLKRTEEMERMREHVFNEADLNKDGFISYEEFLEQTKKPDFQQDEGWEGLDEQQIYTPEEFQEYERRKQEEIQKMIAKGMLPPHPGNIPVHHESFPPQYVNVPVPQGVPPPQQYPPPHAPAHQQQYPDQHHGQYVQPQQVPMAHQQQYPNQVPMQPQVHDQIPPQQQYHPQVPQQPLQGRIPDQQYHQDQVSPQHLQQQQQQQHYQEQVKQQQQQHPGQVPVQHQQQLHQQQQQLHQQQQQPHEPQVQTFQQPAQQQHSANQVPPSGRLNAVPQQNLNQGQQQAQQSGHVAQPPPVQPGMQRNSIHTAGKV